MTLTEAFVKNSIFVDFGSSINYNYDQSYVYYPCVFPTVDFTLMDEKGLEQIADRIRKEAGFRPLYTMDEFTEETCDKEAYYTFFVSLNGFTDSHIDTCIEFAAFETDSSDCDYLYQIDLTEEEQALVYARLDEQFREHLGKSCEELLAESREAMEKEYRLKYNGIPY